MPIPGKRDITVHLFAHMLLLISNSNQYVLQSKSELLQLYYRLIKYSSANF